MSTDAGAPLSRFASTFKDFVAALRDATLFAVFVALLAAPSWVRERLVDAGFTKGSIAGFEWQASLERTKEAAQRVSAAKQENENLVVELSQLAEGTREPNVAALRERADAARNQIVEAELLVKHNLSAQQEIVKAIAPDRPALTGWLYLGAVDEAKTAWKPGAPVSILPIDPAIEPGEVLALSEDRYLRAEGGSGNRAKASVAGLVSAGERALVLEVDHSHARAGGWFVWVRVRALD